MTYVYLFFFFFRWKGFVTVLPNDGEKIRFDGHAKQIKAPFIIYADFECKLVPINETVEGAKTRKKHKHVPSSFAYLIKCSFDESLDHFEIFRGEDCGQQFVQSLTEKIKTLYETYVFNKKVRLKMSASELSDFEEQWICHICKKPILSARDKERDHCHLTGNYRGCAHKKCNTKFRLNHEVSVIFHNFSKYDSHLFIKELTALESNQNIHIIPSNTETYVAVSKSVKLQSLLTAAEPSPKRQKTGKKTEKQRQKQVYLRIIYKDSFRFLSASIDSLSKSLDPDTDFKNLQKYFPSNSEMLKRKGNFFSL